MKNFIRLFLINKSYKTALILFLLIFLIFPITAESETKNIIILHTTDLHGQIYPLEYKGVSNIGGLAKIAAVIKKIRNREKNVILLDAGDIIQGTPMSFYFKGEPIIKVMNHLKYDAAAIGNHDFDFGLNVLSDRIRQAKFPLLSANVKPVFKGHSPLPDIKPYLIKKIDGIKIGIIGITPQSTPRYITPDLYKGIKFAPVKTCVYRNVFRLKHQEKTDLIILLIHGGYSKTDNYLSEPVKQIAEDIKDIDIIIAGHSHKNIPEMTIGNILLTQAHKKGLVLGKILLSFTNGKLTSKRSTTITIDENIPVDEDIKKLTKKYYQETQRRLNKEIGNSKKSFNEQYNKEKFIEIVLKAMLNFSNTDIAMYSSEYIGRGIDIGTIYENEIYRIFPYEDYLSIIKVTGRDIKKLLEYNLAEYSNNKKPLIYSRGLEYSIDIDKNKINNIKFSNGKKEFEMNRVYTVAFNSFQITNSINPIIKSSRITKTFKNSFREIIKKYITKNNL